MKYNKEEIIRELEKNSVVVTNLDGFEGYYRSLLLVNDAHGQYMWQVLAHSYDKLLRAGDISVKDIKELQKSTDKEGYWDSVQWVEDNFELAGWFLISEDGGIFIQKEISQEEYEGGC